MTGPTRAQPGTIGAFFASGPVPDDHRCRATCYRVGDRPGDQYILTMCDYAHAVTRHDTGPGSQFAGSAAQAALADLPAHAPFAAPR